MESVIVFVVVSEISPVASVVLLVTTDVTVASGLTTCRVVVSTTGLSVVDSIEMVVVSAPFVTVVVVTVPDSDVSNTVVLSGLLVVTRVVVVSSEPVVERVTTSVTVTSSPVVVSVAGNVLETMVVETAPSVVVSMVSLAFIPVESV